MDRSWDDILAANLGRLSIIPLQRSNKILPPDDKSILSLRFALIKPENDHSRPWQIPMVDTP
jgi:hypothetical protein